jgi:hypothetical protein
MTNDECPMTKEIPNPNDEDRTRRRAGAVRDSGFVILLPDVRPIMKKFILAPTSGHAIYNDDPELVARAIKEVLQAASKGVPLSADGQIQAK